MTMPPRGMSAHADRIRAAGLSTLIRACAALAKQCAARARPTAFASVFAPVGIVLAALFALPGLAIADVSAAPAISSISPTAGPTAGGTSVTITGSNFGDDSVVQFGGTSAAATTVNSSAQITATAPAGAAGTVDITVTSGGITSATTAADQYTYVAAPSVSSLLETSGPASGGTQVIIYGSNFVNATAVNFGATAAPSFMVLSGTSMSAMAPPGTGTVNVTVTTPGGTSAVNGLDQYTYLSAPTVASISPSTGSTAGGTSVTITGTNFTGATGVKFGTTAATNVFVSSPTSITATSPAGTAGVADVTVTTPEGTSATGASDQFTYTAAGIAPVAAPVTVTVPYDASGYLITLPVTGGAVTSITATTPIEGVAVAQSTGTVTTATYTPTTGFAGSDAFQYTVSNTYGQSTATVSITVSAPTLSLPNLNAMTVGTQVNQSLAATGGHAPYIYGITGTLPTGIAFDTSTALLSGVPSAVTPYNFTITAIDTSTGNGPFTVSRVYQGTVSASVAVPTSPAVTATTPSNTPVTIAATANATGAPFTGLAIVTAPSSGTAVVSGTSIVYTPTATTAGNVSFTYTISNSGGASAPITATVTVGTVPTAAAEHTVTTTAGEPAVIDLSSGATGGPFTGASVVSVSPSSAGTATIVNATSNANVHQATTPAATTLRFVPAATFAGTATITYTLTNDVGTSPPGVVLIAVAARPDPSTNADVVGLINAQIDAARRFGTAQISNYNDRLELLHGTGHAPSRNGISIDNPLAPPDPSASCDTAASPSARDGCIRANRALDAPSDTSAPDARSATSKPSRASGDALPDLAFWTAGSVDFGLSDAGGQRSGFRFTTPGVTAGVDYRISDQFSIGAGFGYGHDSTDIGSDGTKSAGDSYSVALYGSFRPEPTLFVDGVVGFGSLNFDSERWDTDANAFAVGSRSGRETFASLSAGYEQRSAAWLISPYGRIAYSQATLDAFTESGAGIDSLTYFGQTVTTVSSALGLRTEYAQATPWGLLLPYARIEYQHDFDGQSTAGLAYADLSGAGPAYFVTTTPLSQNRMQIGLGTKYAMRLMTFALDYSVMTGSNSFMQSVRLSMSAPW
ncbi:autotransporter domain-containing protein [Pararobbsia silviterrae]|uniref:Autotransporter domain-containing protein n=1 Tax=Pararobbsia silviterrae TaxID=1792498 RepID=A0A494Y9W1_9BURK|nr:autotransporter domain-containing protein [Pararobbsia silviterrae]RKP59156.1 autotransporter domain-containing protein [Pararobbsia silviterrae]